MEAITVPFYEALIERAMVEGSIDSRLDPRVTALCIDNLILMLQYAYTSDYFKVRMKLFVGPDALMDDDKIVDGILGFIKGALAAHPSPD